MRYNYIPEAASYVRAEPKLLDAPGGAAAGGLEDLTPRRPGLIVVIVIVMIMIITAMI